MHTALKEVNENKPEEFLFLILLISKKQKENAPDKKSK